MQVTLRAMRVNAGLSREYVSNALNLGKNTLLNWESGKTAPDVIQFNKLCDLYHCSRDDIFLPDALAKSGQK